MFVCGRRSAAAPPGFVPLSQLSLEQLEEVLLEERRMQQAEAEAEAQQAEAAEQTGGGGGGSRAGLPNFRQQALEAVMTGRSLTAQVIDLDEATGRVILSGKEPGLPGRVPLPACAALFLMRVRLLLD